jgi:CubicO group peptidase (beta-lactamase class C family)
VQHEAASLDRVVKGTCDPRFKPVYEAFERNFQKHGEVGAAVAVYWKGQPMVDLWGGYRDGARRLPWQPDTMVCMMSVAKGISATAMAMVFDRGLIDLYAPVARYWPEFAQAGKADITVCQALSHLAGVPVADSAREGDIYDFDAMARALAAQAPLWPPGTTQVYHSATLGHIVGMLVKKLTRKSLGRFIREEISGPLGADYQIGLTAEEEARCATMIPSPNNLVNAAKRAAPDSVAFRSWQSLPASEDFNSHLWRSSEIPSVNGHGTARGVARIYAALSLGGTLDGVTLGRPSSFQELTREQLSAARSLDSDVHERVAMAYRLNSPPHRPTGPNMSSFGHSGAGGAQSFADPEAQVGYCYGCNKMHDGRDIGPRAGSLIDATYRAISGAET